MDIAALSAPFPEAAIHWRVQGKPFERNGKQSAMALAYLDARDVMDRLDAACGPENWQTEYHETAKGRLICKLSIRINDQWVTKSDGAGDTDVEGEKGAISDALKRAAVSWGIGRYLYRLESPWVACEVSDKGAWRKWLEDPWAKVKGKPPQPINQKPADTRPQITAEAAKIAMQACADLPALGAYWAKLNKEALHVAKEVEAFKEARKSELTQKGAA